MNRYVLAMENETTVRVDDGNRTAVFRLGSAVQPKSPRCANYLGLLGPAYPMPVTVLDFTALYTQRSVKLGIATFMLSTCQFVRHVQLLWSYKWS